MLLAKMSVLDEVRSAERRALAEETTIRLGNEPCNVGVFNLSATGCLIRSETPLRIGAELRIGLPGVGAFGAEVVRSDGLDAGCRFHEPLSRAQLEAAFQRDVVVDGLWTPEPTPATIQQAAGELSPRAKLAYIMGISVALWGLIAAGIALAT